MEQYIAEPLLSLKQQDLLNVFRGLIVQYGINLDINRDIATIPEWGVVALDVEHDETGNMVGIGICYEQSVCYFTSITPELVQYCSKVAFICHNGISDIECLRQWGINVRDEQLIWDSMLLGHILDSSLRSYGLKDMAKRELGIEYPSYDEIVGKRTKKQNTERITLDKQPTELVAMYNALDCFVTYKIYEKQTKGQGVHGTTLETPASQYFNQIEKPISQIFLNMSNRGIRVDIPYLRGLKETLESRQRPLKEAVLNELGPINLNSPKQLLEALHAKKIYPELKGKASTDKRALAGVSPNPIVEQLLDFSELETLLSSFVNPYLERAQEVVHSFFNQCGTRTGRPSCSNPNLLQIPQRTENGKLVRRMFIPRLGFTMGDCDYGQIEPCVLAHLSKDPVLCQLFNEGIDFHAFTADRLGISRDRAKILNLSVGYRATFKSVAAQLQCSESEAQNEIDKWWNLFPELRRWQDRLIYESKRSGFCTTLLGLRIKVDNLQDYNKWRREGAERQLINNITQGSAAEIMKMAMIKIDNLLPLAGLLVQVYDELLFESNDIEAEAPFIKWCMETALKLDVPLTVECKTGTSWADVH